MKRLALLVAVLVACEPAGAASPVFVSPDVPTTETASATTILPGQISRYDGTVPSYTLSFTVPGDPAVDAIHRMDAPGDWLFSVEAPSDLAGALPAAAEPRDVIRFDSSAAAYGLFFCGGSVTPPVPADSNVDALYLEGGDTGNLVVSFDVPTTIGAATFDPADLVRYKPTGGGTCADWALSASNPAFDASASGTGVPTSSNVIGADEGPGILILAFDVPTDLGPPGLTTFLPGQLVAWNGAAFTLFAPLAGWPVSSLVDGVSCLANPGRVPTTITVDKTVSPGQLDTTPITLGWAASCADGGEDYGIYEGTLGTWYSHTSAAIDDCNDAGGDLVETVTPSAGNRYYLVVPHNPNGEGSYGTCSPAAACGAGNERPAGAVVCAAPQVLTPCPP